MNVNELRNRPTMYLFADGVDELLIGFLALFYAAGSSVLQGLPKDWGYGWGGFAGPVLFGLAVFGVVRGRRMLRARITSPRGGYVTPHVTTRQRLVFAVCGCIAGPALIRLLVGFRYPEALAYCALCVGCYVFAGILYRIPYMFGLAALSTALYIWVFAKGGDLLFVMAWQGAMLAVAGGVKLWRFVRSHPIPSEVEA